MRSQLHCVAEICSSWCIFFLNVDVARFWCMNLLTCAILRVISKKLAYGVKCLIVQDSLSERERHIMICPRCGNEWDVSRSPCSRCGLLVWLSGRAESAAPSRTPPPASPHPFAANAGQAPQSVRPNRSVTDPLNQAGQRTQGPHSPPPSLPVSPLRRRSQSTDIRPLMAGTLVHSGRYRLHEVQRRQEWSSGVYEVIWLAQDAQRSGTPVMICELVIPDDTSMMRQSCCENATMAFTSLG